VLLILSSCCRGAFTSFNCFIALSEKTVNLTGFEPGLKSNTLNFFTCLMSIPGMDRDNRPIVSSLPTAIKTQMADLDCLCLRLAVPDLDFLEESALINSSARPNASRHFRRSLVFVTDSMSFDTTIGKLDILSTLWPRLSIISFLAVAAMAEHRASHFSFLLIFLYNFFHDSGGCGA